MATHKDSFNFDTDEIKEGDIFIRCNPSVMQGRIITVDNLTFEKCNMFGVAPNPTWTIKNCAHYGKSFADLPSEPTEDELDDQEINTVLDRLGKLTLKHPDKVSSGIKVRQTIERFNQIMSADGKAVKVESVDGSWK